MVDRNAICLTGFRPPLYSNAMLFILMSMVTMTIEEHRKNFKEVFLMTKRRSWIAIHRVLADLGYTDPCDLVNP
jgi:hypothetical protein